MTVEFSKLDGVLEDFYRQTQIPNALKKAVTYSIFAGGKRLRPSLFLELLEAFEVDLEIAHYKVAAAIEMIHTGSLIHDDLPAMDDDDYRRGMATNHKAFDEATAILAGDALFLDPYFLITTSALGSETIVALLMELSKASGSQGMVAGQILDMKAEGQILSREALDQLHEQKTGQMIAYPFVAAGIISKRTPEELSALRETGLVLGLAFQIRDDLLDASGSLAELGKTPGKDAAAKKATYVNQLGEKEARKSLNQLLLKVLSNLTDLIAVPKREAIEKRVKGLFLDD